MTPETARTTYEHLTWEGPAGLADIHPSDIEDAYATIASLHWQYAVEVRPDEHSEWQHIGPWFNTYEQARAWRGQATIRIGHPHPHDRIIRRPVGPTEEAPTHQ